MEKSFRAFQGYVTVGKCYILSRPSKCFLEDGWILLPHLVCFRDESVNGVFCWCRNISAVNPLEDFIHGVSWLPFEHFSWKNRVRDAFFFFGSFSLLHLSHEKRAPGGFRAHRLGLIILPI